ncbi:hypothetical protein WJ96_05960 [Burkholderia ubonensis]|uniref:Uncharacterized protein n=1 Tax=Burkholderia ubonensis TaxID=101571 RepID=A0AAW3MWB6_9BURK|nr:hypothetical protein [Burkholderia ubonensis]KVP98114.1 hypothetical protein WJ96_05960 [Burkholderia ubonensis]KVZ92811.1 hypothetical protein WL25_17620 [Burkholderia ubonensis]
MTIYQKFFVKGYRWLAVALLGAVLLSAASYFAMVGTYMLNSSWGAPFILSKTSPIVAQLTSQVLQARSQLDTLKVVLDGQKQARETLVQQKTALEGLIGRYETSLQVEKNSDVALAAQLGQLVVAKRQSDAQMLAAVKANHLLAKSVDKELAAGLITETMAATARTQIAQTATTLHAEQVSTVSLNGQVAAMNRGVKTIDGGAASPKALEGLARLSEMKSTLGEVNIKLAQLDAEVINKNREYRDLDNFLKKLTTSPYYVAANSEQDFHRYAFVPYENEDAAKVGSPVYACYFEVILCSQVGTIKAVTGTEERGRHPVFERDIRGFLVELEMTDMSAAKKHSLFFGSRPLLFL